MIFLHNLTAMVTWAAVDGSTTTIRRRMGFFHIADMCTCFNIVMDVYIIYGTCGLPSGIRLQSKPKSCVLNCGQMIPLGSRTLPCHANVDHGWTKCGPNALTFSCRHPEPVAIFQQTLEIRGIIKQACLIVLNLSLKVTYWNLQIVNEPLHFKLNFFYMYAFDDFFRSHLTRKTIVGVDIIHLKYHQI